MIISGHLTDPIFKHQTKQICPIFMCLFCPDPTLFDSSTDKHILASVYKAKVTQNPFTLVVSCWLPSFLTKVVTSLCSPPSE